MLQKLYVLVTVAFLFSGCGGGAQKVSSAAKNAKSETKPAEIGRAHV